MKVLIRGCMILFWVGALFGVLYLSKSFIFRSPQKTINIFSWGDIFDPAYINLFERQTGIKVNISYYATNEELLTKLTATRGVGYDLIVPSDYAVGALRSSGLLKQLDKNKMSFYEHLNPLLLGLPFDPDNQYSVPFEWELFGIGINKDYFGDNIPQPSWSLIFDTAAMPYRIAMVNDPIEAILFAAHYLYGQKAHTIEQLNTQEIQEIKQLLIEQKKRVEAYVDFRPDYFLVTKNCPVVVASSSYILRSMREYSYIDFIMPVEGTFITIENFAIPAVSDKEDLVYQFMNFFFEPESCLHHFNLFAFFPARLDVIPPLTTISISPDMFKKLSFFKPVVSEQQKNDLWVEVKSS